MEPKIRTRRAGGAALASLDAFSRFASPRRLRPYQLEAGEAIIRSVLRNEGKTFTVCMARQSGKNELAAQLEAYLLQLYAYAGGQIVKAAPSFRPQIVNSQLRLREILSTPFFRRRWSERHGYMLELGRARIVFFSADPAANIVGATASILLEVDEAQDVDTEVYFRDLRPMASTANATTVLYGTPWTDDNILEEQRCINRDVEKATGQRLNFEAPWTTLAAISSAYGNFVRAEIGRLGESHPTIRTQYLLQPVAGAGRLFPPHLVDMMVGSHDPQTAPHGRGYYVAGIDIAGQVVDESESRTGRRLNDRDDTVITIVELVRDEEEVRSSSVAEPNVPRLPILRVVAHYRWRGISHARQYDRLLALMTEVWCPARICVDSTGVGAGLASFLHARLPTRVEPIHFTSGRKSQLGFALLAAVETGRVRVYRDEASDDLREFWRQIRALRYTLANSEEMSFSVRESEGHDDFVMSLALAVAAAEAAPTPPAGRLLRPKPDGDAKGW